MYSISENYFSLFRIAVSQILLFNSSLSLKARYTICRGIDALE